ncbi:DNA-binding response regulator, partial [Rhizobium leguminosarum]
MQIFWGSTKVSDINGTRRRMGRNAPTVIII